MGRRQLELPTDDNYNYPLIGRIIGVKQMQFDAG